jgi:hypothetical protein
MKTKDRNFGIVRLARTIDRTLKNPIYTK